jgi:hypothetical protein
MAFASKKRPAMSDEDVTVALHTSNNETGLDSEGDSDDEVVIRLKLMQ